MAVKAKFVRISRYKYPAILESLASGYATVEDAMNLTAEKLAKFIRTEGGVAVAVEARYPRCSVVSVASDYVAQTRRLNSLGSTTEETFYPGIRDFLSVILRTHDLPFEVRTGTSEEREGGTDRPDFVLADAVLSVCVFGEVRGAFLVWQA